MNEGKREIHYTVDGEPQETDERTLTVREILLNAKEDPKLVYLIQVEGKETISYENKLDEVLHMHDGMVFVTASIGPTPVS